MKEKVVIGLWPLSGDFGKIKINTFEKVINFCIESGLRSFDVAPNYGNGFAEKALGKIYGGKAKLIINTKFGNNKNGVKDFSVSALRRSLETSLEDMNITGVQTLFLHNPRNEIKNYDPIMKLMSDLKSEKIIKYSAISVAKGFDYKDLPSFDAIQFDCNLLYLKELEKFQKKFKNTFVRSPLASGILSGNISINSKFPDDDHRSEWLIKERLSYIVSRVEEINAIKGNLTLPSISRKFLLQNKNIHKVIFGIKSIEHVKDIMDDLSSTNIDQNLIQKIFMLEKDRRGIKNDDKGF
tara:strand:+ start:2142 stop:3029 length:888 start_codon:yes stop_codon:yes gene_type:complete